jgi:hypothetical protein
MPNLFEEMLAGLRKPTAQQSQSSGSSEYFVEPSQRDGRFPPGHDPVERSGTVLGGGEYEHGFLIHNPRTGEMTASVHKRVPRQFPEERAYPSTSEYHRE